MSSQKHIHIIGICGVATNTIAIAFKDKGWKVTGSDKGFFPPVSTELENNKIEFYAGWHPEKMGRPDIVMTGGSGTSPNNPEVIYANENNIPVYPYPEVLQKYFIKENSIVTVGTWGKTTNSSLLSYILIQAGFDPSYFTGGVSLSHKSGTITDSKWSVVEGDEYQVSISDKRPKFVYYNPSHLLLTAVSWDHADLYPTEESYFNVFKDLISKTKFIVANKDNDKVRELVNKAVWYGSKDADYVYTDVRQTKDGLDFKINGIDIHSQLIGKFQAENITGCFAMASELGINQGIIIEAIANFKGMKRRLEKRYVGDITVYDDIAHSPEKASTVLSNLREIYDGKIIAIFEPNIGGRSRESIIKYDNAFKDADSIIIPRLSKLKVGDNDKPMEGNELAEVIGKTHSNVSYIEDDNNLIKYLKENTKKGDCVAFLGSHGFRGMIEEFVTYLRQQSL